MSSDIVVVGSGLTGSVVARTLVDAGHKVLLVERRSHVGGNVHDYLHPSGIRIHTYGPHYFRTNNDQLWAFVNRFADFYQYEAILKSLIEDRYENWPVADSYIRKAVGDEWSPGFTGGEPSNFEEASLAMMPRVVYERFVKGYTQKQWGVPAHTLSASLAKRFDVRSDDELRLMRHKHQGLPVQGYEHFMQSILAGIPVVLNCDYLEHRSEFEPTKLLVYTGPIDAFFSYEFGRLAYRGQLRAHEYLPDVDFLLPCGQVNNPNPAAGQHIRTLEWKHMMPRPLAEQIQGTVITRETTVTPNDEDGYEYPFPDEQNAKLYRAYRKRAKATPNVIICGRLGEYRYYDMDQAIARARSLAKRILRGWTARATRSEISR